METGLVSAVVVNWNRRELLRKCLESLLAQREVELEVIVVDNASTDNTAETAKMEWQNFNTPGVNFQVIDELKPGVCNARETGIQNSNFDYILFCDDDNWLHEDYVGVAYNTISANPKMAALGGQSVAVSDIPLPDWFNSSASNYAVGKQAESSGEPFLAVAPFLGGRCKRRWTWHSIQSRFCLRHKGPPCSVSPTISKFCGI